MAVKCAQNYYTTNQFANLVFGKADAGNMAYVSRIASSYRNYFETQGIYKKRLRVAKVLADHPGLMGGSGSTPTSTSAISKVDEMIRALEEEITAIRQTSRAVKVDSLTMLNRVSDKYVFSGLVHIDSDEELILNEGALITLGPAKIQGAVLSYDQLNNTLYFECSMRLNVDLYYYMEVDTVTTINPVIDALRTYSRDGISGLVETIGSRSNYPSKISDYEPSAENDLDSSQAKALQNALQSDVSYIWGPPGTGKSHCLSTLLIEFLRHGEKTLVVSIANVAVDQLLTKVLRHADKPDPFASNRLISDGDISRIGYITEEPLVKRFDNAPASKQILSLYKSIRETQERISNTKSQATKAELTAKKRGLSREVNEIQKKRIERAKLLFTTATKAVMDDKINGTDFDNLVIDEASMMSIPYLFALLKRIGKRVVIAGDFAQLSPISVSQTGLAEKYLKKDLFSLAGIDRSHTDHPSLSILTVNRRATKDICDLYNNAFYQGKMTVHRTDVVEGGVYYVPLDGEGAEKTSAGSRRNTYSFKVVTEFVRKHLAMSSSSIGIISPYRAQVNDYKKWAKEQNYPKDVMGRIKIGTVHTFQGSEAELIVFDTVDNNEIGIGILFHHEQGERIINVAISRARSALVVFGDLEAFYRSNKTSAKVMKVFNSIKSKGVS